MADRYGSTAAERIAPENVPTPGGQPGMEAETLVWADTTQLAVTDSSGETIAESDNYAALYETDVDGDQGYYVYWLWSAARSRETSDWAGELRECWTHVDLTNGGDVTVYDPSGEIADNGTVGPHPEKTGQDTDEFAVRWKGEHVGRQVVTGSCIERRNGEDRGFEWSVHLAGRKR